MWEGNFMKALIFNPFSGASGDMILGCALDLGADRKAINELIEASGFRCKKSFLMIQ